MFKSPITTTSNDTVYLKLDLKEKKSFSTFMKCLNNARSQTVPVSFTQLPLDYRINKILFTFREINSVTSWLRTDILKKQTSKQNLIFD